VFCPAGKVCCIGGKQPVQKVQLPEGQMLQDMKIFVDVVK
jgi:hypothetical protein